MDNRPHKPGGIIHEFFSGSKYMTLTGHVVGDTVEIRQVLYDFLAAWLYSAQATDCRHFFNPPGFPTRFHTVRCYDPGDIVGPTSSQGSSPSGIAGPKAYDFEFVAVNPFAYTYAERNYGSAAGPGIAGGDSVFVANEGNVATWPVIECYAPPGGPMVSFTVSNGVFDVEWTGSVPAGEFIEINMFNETMYLNGASSNKIGGLNDQSDFWSVPKGGCTVSVTPGAHHIWIKSNDAWV